MRISNILFYLTLISLFIPGYSNQTKIIYIDLSTQYQTIQNFGASDCWSFQKIGKWKEENREKVADLLFSKEEGIGLSAWRFNIGAGVDTNRISDPWRTAETFEVYR